jgi:hypothetical protein
VLALLSEVSDLNISATQTLAYDGFVMAKLIILLQEGSIKKHKLAKELSDLVNVGLCPNTHIYRHFSKAGVAMVVIAWWLDL